MKQLDHYLSSLRSSLLCTYLLLANLVLGYVDYLIGPELSFSVFYTGPIMIAGWYCGKRMGIAFAVICSITWFAADQAAGGQYSSPLIPIWNTLVRLAFFLIILQLLLTIRQRLSIEETLADTDQLTGLANRRLFQEQMDREYARLSRYPQPFTIAYFDLDNFKKVNDSQGHTVGDSLLETVASTLRDHIRASDFSARLGGDEFAVLFPSLEYAQAKQVLEKLQGELLASMNAHDWPVTFSIGAITFMKPMNSHQEMISRVDQLMYQVKHAGKNNILHLSWPESASGNINPATK